jgi:hypothetical protein
MPTPPPTPKQPEIQLTPRQQRIYDQIAAERSTPITLIATRAGFKQASEIGKDLDRLITYKMIEKTGRGLYQRKALKYCPTCQQAVA